MKNIKRMLSILTAAFMLISLLTVSVFAAEGTQDNPINANDKWFGYGVDCYLINTTLEADDTDGVWYELTVETAGILQLEHGYKDVDYYVTLWVNGMEYKGYENGAYSRPIATLPVAVGDVATVQIVAQDTGLSGTVYANMKVVDGSSDSTQTIKVKSAGVKVYVAAGATVYYQDDTTNAEYATKGLLVSGDTVEGVSVISSGKTYTDTDGDGTVELTLGGSLGSAGAPPVKPSWAIVNDSTEDVCLTLTVADSAHECVYDDNTDTDCNTCGEIRELPIGCEHEYDSTCDVDCNLCGDIREVEHTVISVAAVEPACEAPGNIEYRYCAECGQAWLDAECTLNTNLLAVILPMADHIYDDEFDADCNVCGDIRDVVAKEFAISYVGSSISEEKSGLAFKFDVVASNIQVAEGTNIFKGATITIDGEEYELVGLGATLTNGSSHVLDIPVVYLCDWSEHSLSFNVRVINIPEDCYDRKITATPYYVYVDADGAEQTVDYNAVVVNSYNGALN